MPPAWKIRRELRRIWGKLSDAFLRLYDRIDVSLSLWRETARFKTRDGHQTKHDKSAVFLIFQPDGLLQSTLDTCKHLDAQGYTITLVTNAPLTDAEAARLLPLCSRILERPNLGYDFAGYKQAVLSMLAEDGIPSRLLLLNDSIWFPLWPECTLLQRLEALQTDLAGPVYHRHSRPDKMHLQSYMILFSQTAVQHPAFRRFWKGYVVSNNPHRTIRYGEMGLTHACAAAGLRVGFLHEAVGQPALDNLSSDEAREVAAYDQQRREEIRARRFAALPQGISADQIDLPTLTNHPVVNLRLLGLHFLKKKRDLPYRWQRKALIDRFEHELSPAVRAEVRSHDLT